MSKYTIISYKSTELPEAYKPMLFSKWLRSLKYGNDYFKLIAPEAYYNVYHKHIESMLTHPNGWVKLSVLQEDNDCVLGWASGRGVVLDYVHVHRDYRRTGLATALIPTYIDIITHVTKDGMSFWHNRLKEAKFNPFL